MPSFPPKLATTVLLKPAVTHAQSLRKANLPLHTEDSSRVGPEIPRYSSPGEGARRTDQTKLLREGRRHVDVEQAALRQDEDLGHDPNAQNTKRITSYVSWGNGHWGWGDRKPQRMTNRRKTTGKPRKGSKPQAGARKQRKFGFKRTKQESKQFIMIEKALTILTLNIDGLREQGRFLALAAYAAKNKADILVASETRTEDGNIIP